MIPHWILKITKNWEERAVLAQLNYYFRISERDNKIRARVAWDGDLWVAKTHKEMAFETGLSRPQVKRAVDRLRRKRLIYQEYHLFWGLRTSHYRLNWDELQEAFVEAGGDVCDPV